LLVSTRSFPALFSRLVDDAAVFPPGSAPLAQAVADHREYRQAWFAPLVGPLLVPASAAVAGELGALVDPSEALAVGLIADTGISGIPLAASFLRADGVRLRQVEVAVAKRGEDPTPGLRELLALAEAMDGVDAFAEIPLTWGLLNALDILTEARARGARVGPKFRTGGLAAELFPTPVELAAVICACRDRSLPFKLTAGLHHAVRHNDPETGFTHHGFLNILAATLVGTQGAEVVDVAELLAVADPLPLVEAVRPQRSTQRPLWTGFGSCSVPEPLADLERLGLLTGPGPQ
jgi:hypothetical protein